MKSAFPSYYRLFTASCNPQALFHLKTASISRRNHQNKINPKHKQGKRITDIYFGNGAFNFELFLRVVICERDRS